MRDWLVLGLEYDLWANQKWMAMIPQLPHSDEMLKVMSHIAAAQRRWLERLGAHVDIPLCDEPSLILPFQNRILKELAQTRDLGEVVDYHNTKGVPYRRTIQEIMLHIINHGTYHRGQIRGMVDPAHLDLISDTDIVYFLPERFGEK